MEAKGRWYLFLYGNGNLLGSLLGLAGLLAHFASLFDKWWLAIVAGLYGIGYLAAPRPPQLHLALNRQLRVEEVEDALEDLLAKIKPHVVTEIYTLVSGIRDSIVAVLPKMLEGDSFGDHNLFTIRQTAMQYLPETLENYLKLPPAYRQLHAIDGQKTAKALLVEQLTLLDGKMKEIVENVHLADSQALLANGRFLDEKFKPQTFLDVS